jgi:hypothetical protein
VGSLKSLLTRLAGLGFTGTSILVAGKLSIALLVGVMGLVAIVVSTVILAGTFGCDRHRDAAQTVLAILLGRKNKPR